MMSKVNGLREVQSTGGEELSALMASVLDKAFKGKLWFKFVSIIRIKL